jgi:CarD family transcriptional regulator
MSSGAVLMVPVEASERAGMRPLFPLQDLPMIFDILRQEVKVLQKTWNKRCKDFNEKLNGGSVLDIAFVVRSLWTLQENKELSYGEKKLLERARNLLVSEICAIRGMEDYNQVEQEIECTLMPH